MGLMKALVKKESAPGLWLEEVPIPSIKPDEVLIKTHKTSICGTDVHIYKWDAWAKKTIAVPMVIGHEFMGEIAQVGSHVKDLKVGERVCGEGHLTCGHCPACQEGKKHLCANTRGLGVHRHGCFAEYFHLPAENIIKIPATISDDIAAIFDPFGNAVHTAMTYDLTAEDVLITGAGPIGIMAAAVAHQAGARTVVITDKNPYRLALAKKLGATHPVNIDTTDLRAVMKSLGIDYGFSVGLEMSGSPQALTTLLETAQHGAHLALLGILPPGCTIDWDLVIFKMLQLNGIYGRRVFGTWHKMIHLIESGLDLAPIITHRFAAADYEEGFAAMLSGQSGKVILDWL